MMIFKQFDSLIIEQMEMNEYQYSRHSHNYYEVIYIHSGSGQHNLNNLIIPYSSGDLFLMSPGDNHTFDIDVTTNITFIRFTDDYFSNYQDVVPESFRAFSPTSVMRLSLFKENKIRLTESSSQILGSTIDSIVAYSLVSKNTVFSPTVFYLLLSVLGLVWETARLLQATEGTSGPVKDQLISYIHQRIYRKADLSVSRIAEHFGISPGYFSSYFKGKIGMSYNAYIAAYRNNLIEQRLKSGNMTLGEIALEFGFFDESHFNKYCKVHFKLSPKHIADKL